MSDRDWMGLGLSFRDSSPLPYVFALVMYAASLYAFDALTAAVAAMWVATAAAFIIWLAEAPR